jgi:hypothetical protein
MDGRIKSLRCEYESRTVKYPSIPLKPGVSDSYRGLCKGCHAARGICLLIAGLCAASAGVPVGLYFVLPVVTYKVHKEVSTRCLHESTGYTIPSKIPL